MLKFVIARRTWALVAAALLAPVAAAAAATGTFSAEYTGYSHGLTVLKLSGTLRLTPNGYAAHVTFHSAGLAGMMVHMSNDSTVAGIFQGDQAMPASFQGTGHFHGTDRVTRIAYAQGSPVIQDLQPPVEGERTAIPTADTAHTIDTLSAVALLIRAVGSGGHCDGAAKTFDGRRLAQQTVHDSGREVLEQTGRSMFAGSALRCDFDGQQLGGFMRDENEADLRKPRHGTAWLADLVPGGPPVPVRVAFDNKILGQVTLYLTSVSGTATSAAN